jgi:hypothetical protein
VFRFWQNKQHPSSKNRPVGCAGDWCSVNWQLASQKVELRHLKRVRADFQPYTSTLRPRLSRLLLRDIAWAHALPQMQRDLIYGRPLKRLSQRAQLTNRTKNISLINSISQTKSPSQECKITHLISYQLLMNFTHWTTPFCSNADDANKNFSCRKFLMLHSCHKDTTAITPNIIHAAQTRWFWCAYVGGGFVLARLQVYSTALQEKLDQFVINLSPKLPSFRLDHTPVTTGGHHSQSSFASSSVIRGHRWQLCSKSSFTVLQHHHSPLTAIQ